MTSRVFDVSFRNEARRVTVNDNTKIGHFIEKSLAIYDLNIDEITGVYFVDNHDEEIFLHDSIHTSLHDTISVLLGEYNNIELFTITSSRQLLTNNQIKKFKRDYKKFIKNNNQQNSRILFNRPYMNITNNYYGHFEDMFLNHPNSSVLYNHPEMYITNNYYNDFLERMRSQQQPQQPQQQQQPPQPQQPQQQQQPPQQPQPLQQPQQQPLVQPQASIPESNLLNRFFNTNANNIEIELNYLYNPDRGRFNIIQNPNRNYIIDYIYNFIGTGGTDGSGGTGVGISGVNEETINLLRRGSYSNLREHILHDCTQCTITLEDFSDTTEVIVLPCTHAFTVDGIKRWLQTNTTCPTCRESVILADG
jgi:hypothetical protein